VTGTVSKHDIQALAGCVRASSVEHDIVETGLAEYHTTRQILLECISMTDEWYEENKKLIGQVLISGMHHTTMGTRAASNRLVVADMLIRVLKAGQSKGEISADVSAEDTATMLVGLFFSITFDWMHDKGAWSLIDGEDQEMCDFLLN
jgi:hypothetical protein